MVGREAAAPLSYRTQTPRVAEAELSQRTPRFTTDVPKRLGLGFMEVLQESIPVYKALPPHPPHPPFFFPEDRRGFGEHFLLRRLKFYVLLLKLHGFTRAAAFTARAAIAFHKSLPVVTREILERRAWLLRDLLGTRCGRRNELRVQQ